MLIPGFLVYLLFFEEHICLCDINLENLTASVTSDPDWRNLDVMTKARGSGSGKSKCIQIYLYDDLWLFVCPLLEKV